MKKINFWKVGIVLVAFIIFLSLAFLLYNYYQKPITYVTFDLNPSIKLSVNRQEKVVDVVPLNAEGDLLVADLKLEGKNVYAALIRLLKEALDCGYIFELKDDNLVAISIVAKELEEDFQNNVLTKLNEYIEEEKIPVIILFGNDNKEIKELANEYNVSPGKMILIQKLVSLNPNLEISALVNESLESINKKMYEARKTIIKENKEYRKVMLIQNKNQLKKVIKNLQAREVDDSLKESIKDFDKLSTKERKEIKENFLNEQKEELRNNIESRRENIKNVWESEEFNNISSDIKENLNKLKKRVKGYRY